MMFDEENGHPGVAQLADPRVELVDFLGIHPGRRLVQQQQVGFCGEGARKLEPPLLAESETAGEFVALVGKIEKLENPADLLAGVSADRRTSA